MVEQIRNLRWDVVLGTLAVAAVLLALPLVRPDLDKLLHVPDSIYIVLAVAGSALAVIGLVGVVALLVALAAGRPSVWCESQPVSKRNVESVFELMRQFFGDETPSTSRMLEWQRRNKTVLTAVYVKKLKRGQIDTKLVGVFKILPLTSEAVELLESEQKTGATLAAHHIVKEGEEVAALYIGDVVASTQRGKAEVIMQLRRRVEGQIKAGISVYTRPLTEDGARLVRKYNFRPVIEELPTGSAGRIHKLIRRSDEQEPSKGALT